MSTNAPPGGAPQEPAPSKSLTKAMQALAEVYMEKHKESPDSPECEAVINMMKAVAELDGPGGLQAPDLGTGDPEMQGPPPEGDPMAAMQAPPMDAGGPPVGGPPMTLDDAIAGLHEETMADAAEQEKRKPRY